VNENLVIRDGERRLVDFWFHSQRRTGLHGADQNIDWLLGSHFHGRAADMMVRVGKRIEADNTVSARGRLVSFATRLDPRPDQQWPIARRCESRGRGGCTPKKLYEIFTSKVTGGRGISRPPEDLPAMMRVVSG